MQLAQMAAYVTQYFKSTNSPIVISNACISGVLAIEVATTLLKRGLYDHVIVAGGDLVSQFTGLTVKQIDKLQKLPAKRLQKPKKSTKGLAVK